MIKKYARDSSSTMHKNTSIFYLFLYEFEKLVKILNEILIFMVKDWINDMFEIILRFIGDLIHGCGCSYNWDKIEDTCFDVGLMNELQVKSWWYITQIQRELFILIERINQMAWLILIFDIVINHRRSIYLWSNPEVDF